MRRFVLLTLLAALLTTGCNPSSAPSQDKAITATPIADGFGPVDMLVFGPHPDDELIACSGVIRMAILAGKRVKVVVCTNGDGLPGFAQALSGKPEKSLAPEDFIELARHRQKQSRASYDLLGGNMADLIFLGYPDSAFDKVYDAKGSEPVRQQYTQKNETYGPAQPDYHSAMHGHPSPYTHDGALADFVELIRTYKPAEVYVTDDRDEHPDHKASFHFVRDALKAVGHHCKLYTFANHAGPEWPWPLGFTPDQNFDVHMVNGQQSPLGLPWPPTHRVPLRPEIVQLKLQAIRASMIPMAQGARKRFDFRSRYFESFAKAEEVFWEVDTK